MNRKSFNKKLVLNKKTVAHLSRASMDEVRGQLRGSNFMTCGDDCDTERTCNEPQCQALKY